MNFCTYTPGYLVDTILFGSAYLLHVGLQRFSLL